MRRLRPPSAWWEKGFALVSAGVILAAVALSSIERLVPPPPMRLAEPSALVLDRHGKLLRAFTDANGRWRLPVALANVDEEFVRLLIAYEDARFARHGGVDPIAIVRALGQAARHREVVSGASTLTMQTVRLLSDDRRRTLGRKLAELIGALQLEQRLDKAAILTLYLNAAPYGGNLEGVRAASLRYFGREPKRLTLAQSALLIALPQSPEARRPDRSPEGARSARDAVLARLLARGLITERDHAEALRKEVPTARLAMPRLAPHLARDLVAGSTAAVHRTTLDRDWQRSLEVLAAQRVGFIGPKVSAAILVADLSTGAIRARVGSAGFLDERRAGHVDMVTAVRSPGSTLKPFIYALAMEAGLIASETLMEDRPIDFADYAPQNFDEDFRGTVTASEALRQSLNVPAVTLLRALGPTRLAARLRAAGAEVALPEGFGPNLALGLGGFGTTLADLASLYGALGNDGVPLALSAGGPRPEQDAARLTSPRAAAEVRAILSRMRPPRNAPRQRIAYKTGTSYGHRDAWAIGFDRRHLVAVWVGRPDGAPVASLTGWTDAAPILFEAFARIGITPLGVPSQPTPNAELPPPLQRLPAKSDANNDALAFAFPPEGAVLYLEAGEASAPLVASVNGPPIALWLLDGRPLAVPPNRRTAELSVTGGHHTLAVVTEAGASQRVNFAVHADP